MCVYYIIQYTYIMYDNDNRYMIRINDTDAPRLFGSRPSSRNAINVMNRTTTTNNYYYDYYYQYYHYCYYCYYCYY